VIPVSLAMDGSAGGGVPGKTSGPSSPSKNRKVITPRWTPSGPMDMRDVPVMELGGSAPSTPHSPRHYWNLPTITTSSPRNLPPIATISPRSNWSVPTIVENEPDMRDRLNSSSIDREEFFQGGGGVESVGVAVGLRRLSEMEEGDDDDSRTESGGRGGPQPSNSNLVKGGGGGGTSSSSALSSSDLPLRDCDDDLLYTRDHSVSRQISSINPAESKSSSNEPANNTDGEISITQTVSRSQPRELPSGFEFIADDDDESNVE